MNQLDKCIQLYLGCNTNKGKFIGILDDKLLIQKEGKQPEEYKISDVGNNLFLYLRHLNDFTEEQSKQLIKEGLSVGRPHGYTFSGNGFVYLLSLSVDLFGLIKQGFAKDIKTYNQKDH